jgi:ubiquinone/menaquinone biosynthesis C-methylase UbiE
MQEHLVTHKEEMSIDRYERSKIVEYWDAIAPRYLEAFCDEFDGKPYDQKVLRDFAAGLGSRVRVCDVGCGPCGSTTRLLADAGIDAMGIDLSSRCVELARQQQPALRFDVMDMARMSFPDGIFHGLVLYYSLHYQPKAELGALIQELARVLCTGGALLIVAKEGASEGWIDDPMGSGLPVFWCDFSQRELEALVEQHGFGGVRCAVREPLSNEIAVRRIYLTAHR